MPRSADARISVTAHYTGYVWKKNRLAEAPLATRRGWMLYQLVRPFNFIASRASGGANLETFLLQRHQFLDELLAAEIEAGRITQVLELACGLSPRGGTFMKRYGDSHRLTYLESDLPDLLEHKKRLLGVTVPGHHFLPIDAFSDSWGAAPHALLDPGKGTIVITEGLLSYFRKDQVLKLWRGIATFLGRHSHGFYLSDIHLSSEQSRAPIARLIRKGIESSVRGRLHLPFVDSEDAEKALLSCGFDQVALLRPSKDAIFRVLRASPRLDSPDIHSIPKTG